MSSLGIILAIIGFGVGFALAFWIKGMIVTQKVKAAETEASRLLGDSKRRAETLLKEADLEVKDRLFKMKSDFDAETKETRSELKKRETHLMQKEENVDRKIEQYEQKDHELQRKERMLKKRENEIKRQELKYQELLGPGHNLSCG